MRPTNKKKTRRKKRRTDRGRVVSILCAVGVYEGIVGALNVSITHNSLTWQKKRRDKIRRRTKQKSKMLTFKRQLKDDSGLSVGIDVSG
jgi:hypothetical protein